MTAAELTELAGALAALEQAIARQDLAAAKAAHDAFHGLLLASARNPLLVAMFNQAQVARLSNISPEHKSFYDPRHLAHHRALLRALRKRDARAASAVVRKHFQSLGLMLEFVTQSRRKPAARVLALVPHGAKGRGLNYGGDLGRALGIGRSRREGLRRYRQFGAETALLADPRLVAGGSAPLTLADVLRYARGRSR